MARNSVEDLFESSAPPINVRVGDGDAPATQFAFSDTFRIGRDGNCQVQIAADTSISRNHAEVSFHDGSWWIQDLKSTNGTYVSGRKIDRTAVKEATKIQLGTGATFVWLIPQAVKPQDKEVVDTGSLTQYAQHYFGRGSDENAGKHTMMIRLAFQRLHAKEKWKYGRIIAVTTILLLITGAYALYLHKETTKQKARAEAIFYTMKSLELDIAGLQPIIMASQNRQGVEVIARYRGQRKEMEANYNEFLSSLGVYNEKLTQPERLILRVARIFGECEVNAPPEFVSEVQTYIRKWQSSPRFEQGIKTAQEKGYTRVIAKEMLAQDLPPQFFYLALQESNFDTYSIGPQTYKGIAKGMWQFIPETAVKYGLRIGPLADLRRPDPGDDRHNFEKATKAAARYLKFIYSTDAQASGLLVASSYNWGEERVIKLIRTMPANPKERNFWRLLSAYRDKIPQETYDYVFYIISAAVIGENPALFGFKFANPLDFTEKGL